ncbi:hypothetical protein LSUCC0387_05465 [Rhodobacterales bacterium LSUCC0387]|nr:hypothetical protein [Rhodobacterales bacterium LSUCC0387]
MDGNIEPIERLASKNARSMCFVIDSPINALMASLIAKPDDSVHLIYALDPIRKDVDEYFSVCRALLDGISVVSENLIEIDSARYWAGHTGDLVLAARQALKPLVMRHSSKTIYFGNCLTNPVALAMKRFVNVNHLYHSPNDFVHVLFPRANPYKFHLKSLVKRVTRKELRAVERKGLPIYTLLNLLDSNEFAYLDFNSFSSNSVETMLVELSRQLDAKNSNIMLLLSGDEPEPGDKNHSNIAKYLQPHLEALQKLHSEQRLQQSTVWIKEHKSYLPLASGERALLSEGFSKLGCEVKFISDYLPENCRLLPGECILKYCTFDFIVAEPSSLLLNVSSGVSSVAAASPFIPYRDPDQVGRNNEFLKINELLVRQCRVF